MKIHFWFYYTKNVWVIDGTIADMVVLWFLLLVMGYFDQLQSGSGWREYKILSVFWNFSEMLLKVAESLEALLEFPSISIISWFHHWERSLGASLLIMFHLHFDFERSWDHLLKRENIFWVWNTGNNRSI